MGGNICSKPLDPRHDWPPGVPPAVSAYWTATGCDEIVSKRQPTITVPQAVESWWVATGSAFFMTQFPLPSVIPGPDSSTPPPPPPPGTTSKPVAGSPTTLSSPTSFTSKLDNGSSDVSGSSQIVPPTTSPPSGGTGHATTTAATATSRSPSSTPENSLSLGNSPDSPSSMVSSGGSTSAASSPTASSTTLGAAKSNKTMPIVVGVVVPLVLITLGIAAFILYKRRQRARDRREWERTHEAIADAVRQVGAPAPAGLPAWNPARGDMKEPSDGDTTPLFDNFGGSRPKFE